MIIEGERVARFVGEKTGMRFDEGCAALGTSRSGEIVTGFAFSGWTGQDVTIALASDAPLTRKLLRRVAVYVWDELGCIRATVETEQRHVADLALRMGGKVEGVKRNLYGPGRDGVVFGILKEDWFL